MVIAPTAITCGIKVKSSPAINAQADMGPPTLSRMDRTEQADEIFLSDSNIDGDHIQRLK